MIAFLVQNMAPIMFAGLVVFLLLPKTEIEHRPGYPGSPPRNAMELE